MVDPAPKAAAPQAEPEGRDLVSAALREADARETPPAPPEPPVEKPEAAAPESTEGASAPDPLAALSETDLERLVREHPRLAAQVSRYGDAHASRSIARIRAQLAQEQAQSAALRERAEKLQKVREGDLESMEEVALQVAREEEENRIRQDERQKALDGLMLEAAQAIGSRAHQELPTLPLFSNLPQSVWEQALAEPSLAGYVHRLVSALLEGYVPKKELEQQITAARQDERVRLRGESPPPDLSGSAGASGRRNGVDWSKSGRELIEAALRGGA